MMTDAIVSVPSMYRTAASTPTVSFINAPTLAWMPCTTHGSIYNYLRLFWILCIDPACCNNDGDALAVDSRFDAAKQT